MNDRYMTLPEIRPIVGNKSRATMFRWCRDGIFPKPYKIGPNSIGWKESEVKAWLESRKISGGRDAATVQ